MDQQMKDNTYVLEPKQDEIFQISKVRSILKEVLDSNLTKEKYNKQSASTLAEDLLKTIREKINDQVKMPRYKLCFQVCIGELSGQGVRITSKCLWDPTFDNYASYSFNNQSLYAVAICFGCYYE